MNRKDLPGIRAASGLDGSFFSSKFFASNGKFQNFQLKLNSEIAIERLPGDLLRISNRSLRFEFPCLRFNMQVTFGEFNAVQCMASRQDL